MSDYTISFVQNDNPEEFMRRLGKFSANANAQGEMPTILFSHTAVTGGFNYAAILIGPHFEDPDEDAIVMKAGE